MSWQGYVDSSLCSSGIVAQGAILSIAGDSAWAKSEGFEIKPEEMKVIASIAKRDKNVLDRVFTDGLHIAGDRYSLVAAPDAAEEPAYCRHADDPTDEDAKKIGIVIIKTVQAIIVARHDSSHNRQVATPIAVSLAEYLTKLGY
jgi:profilin